MGKEIANWGDSQQYHSEPMPAEVKASRRPRVTLLNATRDPLGSLAALCGIYTGRVVRSLVEVTDEERSKALEEMLATALSGPLEVVQFHFLLEGVDRSFTHQAVRGRNAFYAQESLRFAVVDQEPWNDRTTIPPSLQETKPTKVDWSEGFPHKNNTKEQMMRNTWEHAIGAVQQAYESLVDYGMPAEEARGLMPHAMMTRYHWVCDLRELLHVAGLRTCTQAQFHWRLVMAEIARCLREYANRTDGLPEGWTVGGPDAWQWELIADMIRPVCYQTGRCGFMAKFDRNCSIRERVESNAKIGRPPAEWGTEKDLGLSVSRWPESPSEHGEWIRESDLHRVIPPIHDWEWAADPGAARR